jgi:hypothetical protein
MRTVFHPASERDLRAVVELRRALPGKTDTPAAILGNLDAPMRDFATRPWRIGQVDNECSTART